MFNGLFDSLINLRFLGYLGLLLDIYLVWIVTYLLLNLIKLNVRTLQLLKGVIFIFILHTISGWLNLTALRALVSIVTTHSVLVAMIIFQPEIRGALEQIGINAVKGSDRRNRVSLIDSLCQSAEYLSKRRIGALIVIEQDVKLDEFLTSATIMDSKLSFELLNTIFVPTTPLHDGAVIIRNENIYCAGAYLPLTTRENISKELGTRHRAAIGASEITDGVVLVVSEETGTMSIARKGRITRFETIDAFKEALHGYIK
ncbi:MAG: diadenylate cyclase CdaA [Defluviitaleaceae bacterium]|nr:diadenylate cyclase CdaA [Defluviitaleaceae bacterium]